MCEHDDLDEFALHSGELTRRRFAAMTLGAGVVAALPRLADAAATRGADLGHRDAGWLCGYLLRASRQGPSSRCAHLARHLRPASRLQRDGNPACGIRLRGAGHQPVLSHTEGPHCARASGFQRSFDPASAHDAGRHADAGDGGHRCQGLRRVSRRSTVRRQKPPDRYHGILHGRPVRPAYRCIFARSNRRRRHVSWWRPRHRPTQQSASPDPEGESPLPDRDRRERRSEATDGQGRAARGVCQCRPAGEIEVYAGTQHGWCPPDSAVYNPAAAEKAWRRLLVLFGAALG